MATLLTSSGNLLADRRFAFARDLAARGDLDAAVDLLAQTVVLAPDFAAAWYALGDLQDRLRMSDQAAQSFRQALRHDRDDRHGAGLRLARLGVAAADMPPAYVETLFDQYAERFERALLDDLAYRGPALLRAAVERASPPSPRFARMLDLGCGTGLAGAALRPCAGRMIGVDLSPGMIGEAERKQLYDRLEVAELNAFLNAEAAAGARFDLIVAADVFVYMADLPGACARIARVLAPDGLFAFTVETHEGEGMILGATLRYAHAPGHVQEVLARTGLRPLVADAQSIRSEKGMPVPSLVVVAGHDPPLASAG